MVKFEDLLEKIQTKKAKIGIIGQGYVGLPLAVCFAKNGFLVTGLDVNRERVKKINFGMSDLINMGIEKDLEMVVKKGRLSASTEIVSEGKKQDVLIICVPTPIDENKRPEISLLKKATLSIALTYPLGKLIVNESTVAPFTTRRIIGQTIQKKTNLIPGKDFFLGCSPERVNPGDLTHQVENTQKIVAGLAPQDLQLVKKLYGAAIKANLISVGSLEAAESVKLLENSFRAVNIALVNELAKFCQKNELDVLEIIEAAKSKWTFMAHYPGIGVGGHCIPVDPYYLIKLAADCQVKMPILGMALAQNESMPKYVLTQLLNYYSGKGSLLVYGISYKAGVRDMRESPALEFCHLLKKKKIKFEVYDPFYRVKEIKKLGLKPCLKLRRFDYLVVATGHLQLTEDARKIIDKKTIIIDGRNFFTKKIGKKVIGVGRKLE